MKRVPAAHRRLILVLAVAVSSPPAPAQQPISARDRERVLSMLEQMKKDLFKYYYDTTFGGVDMEASYARAEAIVQKAPSMSIAFGALAQYYGDLNDSHTSFYPPALASVPDYGFDMQAFGDTIRVTKLRKDSDAEKVGLQIGDRILAFDGMLATRKSQQLIEYVYHALSPRLVVRLGVQSEMDSVPREIVVRSSLKPRKAYVDIGDWKVPAEHLYLQLGDSILYWHMPLFWGGGRSGVDDIMRFVRGRRGVILDLRNNGGGSVETLHYLIGKFFDRDVAVGTVQWRDSTRVEIAKPTDRKPYRYMLVVLVNSNSASASEMFARVLQAEGRAIVVGDRTMGAVVTSLAFSRSSSGMGRTFNYYNQISIQNVLMPDGERLEGKGVTPNHLVIPSAADLRLKRDPQLAKAFELLGIAMTPDEAGEFIRGKRKK